MTSRSVRKCMSCSGSAGVRTAQQFWLLAEVRSSRAVFDLNNRKSGVNRHLRFCQFPKNSKVCRVGCILLIKPWHHTLYVSELKYAPTHGTFPSFLEIDKTASAYSLQIYDYLRQIQTARDEYISANSQTQHRRHNTEDTILNDRHFLTVIASSFSSSDWRIESINLVSFFKPWFAHLL